MKFNNNDKAVLGVGSFLVLSCVVILVLCIGSLENPFDGPYSSFNRFCSRSTAWVHSNEFRQRMVFNRALAMEHYFNCMNHGNVGIAIQEQKVVFSYCNMLGDDCKPWLDSMGGIPVVPQKLMVQE